MRPSSLPELLAERRRIESAIDAIAPKPTPLEPDNGPPDDAGLGWVGGQWAGYPRGRDAVTVPALIAHGTAQ